MATHNMIKLNTSHELTRPLKRSKPRGSHEPTLRRLARHPQREFCAGLKSIPNLSKYHRVAIGSVVRVSWTRGAVQVSSGSSGKE